MVEYEARILADTAAPGDRPVDSIDVADLGPPEPLRRTLNWLADDDGDAVLVQINDRAPQHLYPKLEDRGYEYGTVEYEDVTVTAIWR